MAMVWVYEGWDCSLCTGSLGSASAAEQPSLQPDSLQSHWMLAHEASGVLFPCALTWAEFGHFTFLLAWKLFSKVCSQHVLQGKSLEAADGSCPGPSLLMISLHVLCQLSFLRSAVLWLECFLYPVL